MHKINEFAIFGEQNVIDCSSNKTGEDIKQKFGKNYLISPVGPLWGLLVYLYHNQYHTYCC